MLSLPVFLSFSLDSDGPSNKVEFFTVLKLVLNGNIKLLIISRFIISMNNLLFTKHWLVEVKAVLLLCIIACCLKTCIQVHNQFLHS